jgi:hypothetical protein
LLDELLFSVAPFISDSVLVLVSVDSHSTLSAEKLWKLGSPGCKGPCRQELPNPEFGRTVEEELNRAKKTNLEF